MIIKIRYNLSKRYYEGWSVQVGLQASNFAYRLPSSADVHRFLYRYGDDDRVTEAYQKDIWNFGS